MISEQAANNEVTTAESKIPVVYYDGFDETSRAAGGYYDEDDDLDDSDGFIFDFKPKAPAQTPAPALVEKKRNDSWSGEPPLNDKNNNSMNTSSQLESKSALESLPDKVANNLRRAIEGNNFELVQDLFKKHDKIIDPNYVYRDNYWTPIMFAVSEGNVKIAKLLVEKGADPTYDDNAFSVLMCACGTRQRQNDQKAHVEVVKLLVELGLEVNEIDKFEQTPLIYASRAGNTGVVELLVNIGADIDAVDDEGWTALTHAAKQGHYNTVRLLLKLGANPLIQTKNYLFAHQVAKNARQFEVESIIRRFIENDKYEKKYLKNLVRDESFQSRTDEADIKNAEALLTEEESAVQEKPKPVTTASDEDLVKFLNGLNLAKLLPVFEAEKIKMKDLLQFSFSDLTQLGITDGPAKKLISDEIRKINLRSWSSSSLIPLRHDSSVNCNEAIAVVSNINRQISFLSANLKYIQAQVMTSENQDMLSDGFLNAKLLECAQKCAQDVSELEESSKTLAKALYQKVDHVSDRPVDHIQQKSGRASRLSVKWTLVASGIALATIGLSFSVGRLGIFKKSF